MLFGESRTNHYVRSVTSHRKHSAIFQPKRGVTKSRNIDENSALTSDDLHQMTLPGLNVKQYMYVLFDQVHIYIQKPQCTLAPCSEMPPKHLEKLRRATSTEILIIN